MAVIRLTEFKGIAPSIPERSLPDTHAQTSTNCRLDNGNLRPYKELSATVTTPTKSGTKQTIFNYEDTYWCTWVEDVDVVRSPVVDDQDQRIYFTGYNGYPRFTTNELIASGGTNYPEISHRLGVAKPGSSPIVTEDTLNQVGTDVEEINGAAHKVVDPNHGLITGDKITIASYSPLLITNETYYVTKVDSSNFTLDGTTGTTTQTHTDDVTYTLAYDNEDEFSRRYVYTFVTRYGEEGPPSNVSGIIDVADGHQVTISNLTTDSPYGHTDASSGSGTITQIVEAVGVVHTCTDVAHGLVTGEQIEFTQNYAILGIDEGDKFKVTKVDDNTFTLNTTAGSAAATHIDSATWDKTAYGIRKRIYRTLTGSSGTDYQYVGEVDLATTTYVDTVEDKDLGEVIPSLSWLPPPADMTGLIALPNGSLAGFVDNRLYFSERYIPHAYPDEYYVTVGYPIVGIAPLEGNSLLVATEGYPYIVSGSDPANMVPDRLDLAQACVSKRSIVDMGTYVIYASPDGLVKVSAGGTGLVTEGVIDRDWWQTLGPENIDAYLYEGEYLFVVGNTVYVFKEEGQSLTSVPIGSGDLSAGYTDLKSDLLYLMEDATDGDIVTWNGSATKKTYTWKSKKFTLTAEGNFSWAQVRAKDYTSLTLKIYADGVLKTARGVANSNPFRLAGGYWATDYEIQLEGTSEVEEVVLAQSIQELANV